MLLTTILVFIIVFGLLVFFHEFGHFSLAKIFKVGVEEFGFGYPPKIFGIKKGKTLYSLNWIPLGGFCKIKGVVGGDQPLDKNKKTTPISDDSFIKRPIWQRASILIAGVVMNVFLCMILLSIGYLIGLPDQTTNLPATAQVTNPHLTIVSVAENSPAALASLASGDIIKQIGEQNIITAAQLTDYTKNHPQETVQLTILRADQEMPISVNLGALENDQVTLGVYLSESGTVRYPWYLAIYYGVKKSFIYLGYIVMAFYYLLKQLIFAGQVSADVAGPVGIALLINDVTKLGFIYILQFTALLSLNLAIFNLLPIPALDGGRLVFLVVEKIRHKPVSPKIENLIHNIGFILLIILVILVTFRDLGRFF